MLEREVTGEVGFGNVDDESLPLTRCICGATWKPWHGPILSIYADRPTACPACGRQFYFTNAIRIIWKSD